MTVYRTEKQVFGNIKTIYQKALYFYLRLAFTLKSKKIRMAFTLKSASIGLKLKELICIDA